MSAASCDARPDAALAVGQDITATIVAVESPLVQDVAAVTHRCVGPNPRGGDVAVEGVDVFSSSSLLGACLVMSRY